MTGEPETADEALAEALQELTVALDMAHGAVTEPDPGPDLDRDELIAVLEGVDEVERALTQEVPRKLDRVVHELTEALRHRGMSVEQARAEVPAARVRLAAVRREQFERFRRPRG
jgi:hypothetical protein